MSHRARPRIQFLKQYICSFLFTDTLLLLLQIFYFPFLKQMIQREADVKNKVTAVALTDSVHNVWHQEAGKTIREWMREVRLGFFLVLR